MGHRPPAQQEIAESLPLSGEGMRLIPGGSDVELRSRATTAVVGTMVQDGELATAPSTGEPVHPMVFLLPRLEEHPTEYFLSAKHANLLMPLFISIRIGLTSVPLLFV
jgi:hypothetical protein